MRFDLRNQTPRPWFSNVKLYMLLGLTLHRFGKNRLQMPETQCTTLVNMCYLSGRKHNIYPSLK